jgi:two-component system NarL family response regulator
MEKTARKIRVLIVDDHIAVAESLRLLLSREPDFDLAEMAHDADDALRIVRASRPDVVLMDHGLPRMTGADATSHVLSASPETAVVMFSGAMTDDELATAVESGVRGYVTKGASAAEVVAAIRRAAAGEILLSPEELARLLKHGRQRARQRAERERQVASLTPREREVLALMAEALDLVAIAERLGISANTARGYVQAVLEKMHAHSKLEAVVRANELGMLAP